MDPVTLALVLRYFAVGQQVLASIRSLIAAWRSGNPENNTALVLLYREFNPGSPLTDDEIVALFDTKFDETMIDLFYKNAVLAESEADALIARLKSMGAIQ